jgi:hypothetical protein
MTSDRSDAPDRGSDLSEAARAAVRDAGDPRIDAHLRALGLAPDPAPASPTEPAPAPSAEATAGVTAEAAPEDLRRVPGPTASGELAGLLDRVAGLERDLAASERRVRWLVAGLLVSLAGLVGSVLLLLGRAA